MAGDQDGGNKVHPMYKTSMMYKTCLQVIVVDSKMFPYQKENLIPPACCLPVSLFPLSNICPGHIVIKSLSHPNCLNFIQRSLLKNVTPQQYIYISKRGNSFKMLVSGILGSSVSLDPYLVTIG